MGKVRNYSTSVERPVETVAELRERNAELEEELQDEREQHAADTEGFAQCVADLKAAEKRIEAFEAAALVTAPLIEIERLQRRIAELETEIKRLTRERDQSIEAVQHLQEGKSLGPLVEAHTILNQQKHIAELEAENKAQAKELRKWLRWSENKGPGIDAYREQGQKIFRLTTQLESANKRLAELEDENADYQRQYEVVVKLSDDLRNSLAELERVTPPAKEEVRRPGPGTPFEGDW